jgi:hypothetical protein
MYRIVGADGRQYGPVSTDQLRHWILEGRANAQTQTFVEGGTEWRPLGLLPEFAASFGAQSPPPVSPVYGSYQRTTNSYALWGAIFGILSICCCCCCCANIPFGALGLIFSLVGLSQISDRPDVYEGRGFAIAGIVLSALGLVIGLLAIFANAHNGNFYHNYNWNYQWR